MSESEIGTIKCQFEACKREGGKREEGRKKEDGRRKPSHPKLRGD